MLLALDVYYKEDTAKAVGVLFEWDDQMPQSVIIEEITTIAEYVPGEFYKRELPCIERIFEKVDLAAIETVIIDGYVYVENDGSYGLGGYTWESLERKIPVIGVAKTSFFSNKSLVAEVFRGESAKPLYVSAVGMDLNEAAVLIKNMKGAYRMPSILKEMDRITKE